jgi:hypothetical protein
MSSKLKDDPRAKCSMCPNYATAACDVYGCGKLLCHQHKRRTFGVDCCPAHYPKERARQSEIAVTKQQSLFEEGGVPPDRT